MTVRVESIADYDRLVRHPGPTSPRLVQMIKESVQERIEQGLDPQIVDVIAAIRDPAEANKPDFLVEVGDGNNRVEALMQLGLPVRASIRMTPWARGEVVKMRATTVLKRKNATAAEMAAVLSDCRKEMGFATWKETGDFLGLSPASVSRILGYKGIPERLRPSTEPLGAVVCQMIGKVRPVERMEEVIRFALGDGKPANKEQVSLFIKRLAGEKRGRKPQTLTLRIDGRVVTIELKPDDRGEQLLTLFEVGTKRVAKYKDAPAHTLGFLSA